MDRQEIISYQEHYTDIYEYSSIGGKSKIDRQANDIVRFFSDEQYCPFCKSELITTFILLCIAGIFDLPFLRCHT